jgi:hypothetical protein
MMNPLSQKTVNMIDPNDRKIPRKIFEPTRANVVWRIRDKKIYTLYDVALLR